METKKIIWEPKLEEKLVELIKQKDFMWNTTHTNFSNLRKRKETFAEIARDLGAGYTENFVKERWRNIRNTYRFNLRRVRSSKRLGKPQDVYEPSWHLWSSLQFLHGHEKSNDESQNITHTNIKIENESSSTAADELFQCASNSSTDNSKSVLKGTRSFEPKDVVNDIHNINEKSKCEKLLEEATMILKLLENDPRLDMKINIKYASFGKEVANCLSSMSVNDADEASKKIIDILSSYSQTNKIFTNVL